MIPLIVCLGVVIAAIAFPDVHNLHAIKDQVLGIVGTCSFLHSFLPPWDWEPEFVTVGLEDFPRAQKLFLGFFRNRWYKLAIYIIGYAAVNFRSTTWRSSISMSKQFEKLQPGKL